MPRRFKDDVILDHPVRQFLHGLVGVVNGAEEAITQFDKMARESMEMEFFIHRVRELDDEAARVLGEPKKDGRK